MIYLIVIMVFVAVLALVTIARTIRLLDRQWSGDALRRDLAAIYLDHVLRQAQAMGPIPNKEPVWIVQNSMRYVFDPMGPERVFFIKRDIALALGRQLLDDGKIEFWDEDDSRDEFLRARRITGRIKVIDI